MLQRTEAAFNNPGEEVIRVRFCVRDSIRVLSRYEWALDTVYKTVLLEESL